MSTNSSKRVKKCWTFNHLKELYQGDELQDINEETDECSYGTPPLRSEFNASLRDLKNKKAPGIDGNPRRTTTKRKWKHNRRDVLSYERYIRNRSNTEGLLQQQNCNITKKE